MRMPRFTTRWWLAILPLLLLAGSSISASSQQNTPAATVKVTDTSIGGVVTSTKGPEALEQALDLVQELVADPGAADLQVSHILQ